MRRYFAISSVLVLAACYHGPSIYTFEPVRRPAGIDADLRLRTETVVQGELLEVQDSSLIILTDSNRVTSVPVNAIRRGRFDWLGDVIGDGFDQTSALAQLRSFSRFPDGLTPELRARLLAAYGQAEVDVAR